MARVNPNRHSRRLVNVREVAMLMRPAVGCCACDKTEAGRGECLIFLQTERDANDVGGVRLEHDSAAVVIERELRLSCKRGYCD
jgi:hypothetical protein